MTECVWPKPGERGFIRKRVGADKTYTWFGIGLVPQLPTQGRVSSARGVTVLEEKCLDWFPGPYGPYRLLTDTNLGNEELTYGERFV